MKFPLYFLLWLILHQCQAQNIAMGIKSGFAFAKMSVEYRYPVGDKSRNANLLPFQSVFFEGKLGKKIGISAETGYRKNEADLKLIYKNPSHPFLPDLERDAYGDLKINQLHIALLPQYKFNFGKTGFGYFQAGVLWNRIIFEKYPCCIQNHFDIGENKSNWGSSLGGGAGISPSEILSFSLDFQRIKLFEKTESSIPPSLYNPVIVFKAIYLLSLKLSFLIAKSEK